MSDASKSPELSVVIPVYNEQGILEESLVELCAGLDGHGLDYEVLLAENGSRDDTVAIAQRMAAERAAVRMLSYPEPNYGGALREGIYQARGRYVVCDEIDLCDVDFHLRALSALRDGTAQMVIGSKAMRGAGDTRPLARRLATRAYNGLLRVTLGFSGTDTHGLKAFVREPLLPVVSSCVVEHDVFASELVIRAERAGLSVLEIPVRIEEKRAPSIKLYKRVPRVLGNLGKLMRSIHGTASPGSVPDRATAPRGDEAS
ncbi:MAG: glycosyltransferase [Myxococcota bacterium]